MPEMKDSGIPWIGLVPKGWSIKPIRADFEEATEKNKRGLVQNALKFTYGNIVPKENFDADNDNYVAGTILGYTIVIPGTIMLNGLNLNFDFVSQRIGLVKDTGVITSAYIAFRAIENNRISPEFITYLLKSYDGCKAFHNMGGGVRKILNFTELKKQYIVYPSLDEQRRIASFLDAKCAEINALAADIRAQIDTLEQYKRSVITEAVTKGLNPDTEMRDSGNMWFPQISISASISKPLFFYEIVLGKMVCSNPSDGMSDYKYYCAANVHFDGIDESVQKRMYFSNEEIRYFAVRKGDLLVVEGGAGAGGAAIVEGVDEITGIQNSILRVRENGIHSNKYLYYTLYLLVNSGYIDFVCNKATIPHFTKEKLVCVPMVLWDEVTERKIVQYLDSKCHEIDAIIVQKKEQLETLGEYKKSIIFEYVTGKKEVTVT